MAKAYVFSGAPLQGKSCIAKIIRDRLCIPSWDIDDLFRQTLFGNPGAVTDSLNGKHDADTTICYRAMLGAAAGCLEVNRDVIITATFMRGKRQELLYKFMEQYPKQVEIVNCCMLTPTEDEILRRLERRNQDPLYAGGVRTLDEYLKVMQAIEPLQVPYYLLDTSPPKTVEGAVAELIYHVFQKATILAVCFLSFQ